MCNRRASLLFTLLIGCSGGREPSASRSSDADHPARPAAPDAATEPPARSSPEVTYSGSFSGRTTVGDGGLQDGAALWQADGSARIAVTGDNVDGSLDAQGLTLRANGNVAGGKLRAWLRSTGAGPRFEGVMLGELSGDSLSGSFRVSGPTGIDVREGRFEARR